MATNKNAIIRYQALDQCFRNPGRKYYMDELIIACNEALLDIDPESTGIKRRQVYEDIKFMKDSRGYDAPIESFRDGRKAFYRYADMNFTINKQPLNEQEAQQLRESLMTLSRFSGLPQFEWVEEMKLRLEQSFKLKTEDKILSFDENPYLTGREYIGDLYNAIINKQALIITYKPFKTDVVRSYDFHPYYLKQYNNRWFLWGLEEKRDNLTNLPLDRIQSIKESKTIYQINTKINFDEYFEDVIGVSVTPNVEPQKVCLKIAADLWPYIKTKPLHGSQKTIEINEKYIKIELALIPNYEFYSMIFSHGDNIEIVGPDELRHHFKAKVNMLYKRYF